MVTSGNSSLHNRCGIDDTKIRSGFEGSHQKWQFKHREENTTTIEKEGLLKETDARRIQREDEAQLQRLGFSRFPCPIGRKQED